MITPADRAQIAIEMADEFEATLVERLAAWNATADAHRAKLKAKRAKREAVFLDPCTKRDFGPCPSAIALGGATRRPTT